MNVKAIKERVDEIEAMKADDEAAHSMEDALHQDVLAAIANGYCDAPEACAEAALKTRDIEFARWCA